MLLDSWLSDHKDKRDGKGANNYCRHQVLLLHGRAARQVKYQDHHELSKDIPIGLESHTEATRLGLHIVNQKRLDHHQTHEQAQNSPEKDELPYVGRRVWHERQHACDQEASWDDHPEAADNIVAIAEQRGKNEREDGACGHNAARCSSYFFEGYIKVVGVLKQERHVGVKKGTSRDCSSRDCEEGHKVPDSRVSFYLHPEYFLVIFGRCLCLLLNLQIIAFLILFEQR